MSKGFQSPGGSAASDSDVQPKPKGAAATQLALRLRLSLVSALDASMLAGEVHAAALKLHHVDGNAAALALSVLAKHIERLTNAVCSALDDPGEDIGDLIEGLYPQGRVKPLLEGQLLYVQELIGLAHSEGALQ